MKRIICFSLALLIFIFSFSALAADTVKADMIASLNVLFEPYFGNTYTHAIEVVFGAVPVTEAQSTQVLTRVKQFTNSVTPRGGNSTIWDYSFFELYKMADCAKDCCDILNIQYDLSLSDKSCTITYGGKYISETINGKPSTCSTTGYSGDKVCPVCGKVYEQGTVTPTTEHTPSDWIVETPATYESEGLKYQQCLVCGKRVQEAVIDILEVKIGDVNISGEVDLSDAITLARYCSGLADLSEKGKLSGDVNRDGRLDIHDPVLIARFNAGLIDTFDVTE